MIPAPPPVAPNARILSLIATVVDATLTVVIVPPTSKLPLIVTAPPKFD